MHAGAGSFPHFQRSLLLKDTVGMQVQAGSDISPSRSPSSSNPRKKEERDKYYSWILFKLFRQAPPFAQNSSCGTKFSFSHSDRQMTPSKPHAPALR